MKYNIKEQTFEDLAELIVNTHADELEAKQPLPISRKLYVEGKIASLVDSLQKDYKTLLSHMQKLNAILVLELHTLPQVKRAQHRQEFILATNRLKSEIDSEELTKAGSWQALLKLSNETLLWIYQLGLQRFQEENFEEALSIFFTLALLNSHVCDYLIALGTTQQSLSLEIPALHTFSLASILEPEHEIPRCRCAEIYTRLEQFDDALLEIEALGEIIKNKKLDSLRPHFELLENKAKNKQST